MEYFTDQLQAVIETRIECYMAVGDQAIGRLNNVLHFGLDAADPVDEEDHLAVWDLTFESAKAVHGMWEQLVMPFVSEVTVLSLVRAKIIHPFVGPFSDFADQIIGAAEGVTDEPDDAMVIQKRTARAGREHQGRIFIGYLPDDLVENGRVSAGFASDVVSGLETTLSEGLDADGSVIRHGVWSRKLAGSPGTIEEAFAPIGALTADLVVRRMGSRERPFRVIWGNSDA